VEGAEKQPVAITYLTTLTARQIGCPLLSSLELGIPAPGDGGDTARSPSPATAPHWLGPQAKSRVNASAVIAAFLLVQRALGLEALREGCE